jgi:predicted aspartyl protease
LLTLNCYSQKPKQVLEWINTVRCDNKDFYFEIPFEYRNNLIIIKVTIGNKTYDYIFDTGGYNDITDDIQKTNNFQILTTQTVGSANGIKSKINIVKVDSLKIGELTFKDVAALQMNFAGSPTVKCTIDGALIGASIIKNYIWQIDFSRKKIIVTDQLLKISKLNEAIKIPVTFNSRLMPYINANIDGKKESFMFDLGSSTKFSLTEKTASKYTSNKKLIEIEGIRSEGGNGTLVQTATIFKADSLEILSIKYKNQPILYSHSGVENLIGNPIIKNFIVTLNFKNNELYLFPIPDNTLTDGWETFGFIAEYKNEKVLVSSIFKGLSADKAGLKIDDEITGVNGQPIDCKNYCDCMLAISKLLNENTQFVIDIISGQTPKQLTVLKEKAY